MPTSQIDPLANCLLAVAHCHGIGTSLQALTSGLPLENSQLTPSLVERAAKRIGFACQITKQRPADIKEGLLPAIVLQKSHGACVLLSRNLEAQTCEVIFPELSDATVSMSLSSIEDNFSGITLLLRPRFHFDARAPKRVRGDRQHWFWSVVLENAPLYRDVLLAAFLINLFAVASPLFVMNIYDRVVPNFAEETLWALAIGMLIIILVDVILRSMRGYFLDLAGQRADVKLSAALMEKLLGLRLEVRPISAGSFASNMRSFETVRDFFASATIVSLIDLPFALVFIGLIGWLSWSLMIPLLIAAIIIICFALATSRKMQALAETSYSASAQRNATLIETLVGLDTLKALGAEGTMQRRWERASNFMSRVTVQLRLLAASNTHAAAWAQQTAYVSVIVGGVYLIADGRLSLGGLIACSILTSRALAPFAQLGGLITHYHTASTALTSLNGMMDQPIERPAEIHLLSRKHYKGDIEFKGVSFQYPGSDVPSLRNISLKIKAGEKIAILGRIGSGKSTLQRLIMGMYQATEGAIHIDGIDIRQLDLADLRHNTGYAAQDVTLFFGSLRDNLLIAQPQLEDEDALQAIEIAGLADFVKSHPRGIDMLIGERGESLSGGQRKAVSLARGIVHNPNILLLDEPTGSMDHSTEITVKKNLEKFARDKTLIMVTHHTALLDMVDRIIVIDAGKVVADGPKQQVIDALRKGRIGSAA